MTCAGSNPAVQVGPSPMTTTSRCCVCRQSHCNVMPVRVCLQSRQEINTTKRDTKRVAQSFPTHLKCVVTRQHTGTSHCAEHVCTCTLEQGAHALLGNDLLEAGERAGVLDSLARGHHHATTDGVNGVGGETCRAECGEPARGTVRGQKDSRAKANGTTRERGEASGGNREAYWTNHVKLPASSTALEDTSNTCVGILVRRSR